MSQCVLFPVEGAAHRDLVCFDVKVLVKNIVKNVVFVPVEFG